MNICIAQTRPFKGDIEANIKQHKQLIEIAVLNNAEMIVFPELSITGYEPELANELATHPGDKRFDIFQKISDEKNITIGIGVPTKNVSGNCITMVLFQPHQSPQTYSKKYLHADEEPFFVNGKNSIGLIGKDADIALAICYEISVPEHSEKAHNDGAKVYVASVAKSVSGVEKAMLTLSDIAQHYSMTVFMSNCVGYCDNFQCGGKSSVWNEKGALLAQLNEQDEGIIMYDTETGELVEKIYVMNHI